MLQQRYYDASQKVDWFARQIRHPQQKLNEQRNQLFTLSKSLRFAMQNNERFNQQRLSRQQQQLAHLRPDPSASNREISSLQHVLKQNWQILFSQRQQRLEKQAALLEAISPQHILERGFSVVKNSRGQVISSTALLKQGQKLHITFADGEADVRVTAETAQPDLFDLS